MAAAQAQPEPAQRCPAPRRRSNQRKLRPIVSRSEYRKNRATCLEGSLRFYRDLTAQISSGQYPTQETHSRNSALPCSHLARCEMPVAAQRTPVGDSPTLHSDDHRRVERIALRPIPALPGAHAAAFVGSGFLHLVAGTVPQTLPPGQRFGAGPTGSVVCRCLCKNSRVLSPALSGRIFRLSAPFIPS